MIHIECLWELNEIVIAIDPTEEEGNKKSAQFVLHDHLDEDPRYRFGTSRHGSISLDVEQAKKLAIDLFKAINRYEFTELDNYVRSRVEEALGDFDKAAKAGIEHSKALRARMSEKYGIPEDEDEDCE